MPTRKITDLFVAKVKAPTKGRMEYFDASFPGLALRVTANGHKSWSMFYRHGGKLRRLTLGSWPAIMPATARREAADALDRVRRGIDPGSEKKQRRSAAEADTFGSLVADYLAQHIEANKAPRTVKEVRRILHSGDLAPWHDQPIGEIGKRDVIAVIDRIARRAPVQANCTLAWVKGVFGWAVKKDRLATSPAANVDAPAEETPRDRILSDDEIRWLWAACEQTGWPYGPLIQLLLLTAQRREEVGGLAWHEIDLEKRIWTLPGARAKNDREHAVQLSDQALAILNSLPRIASAREFIFSVTGKRPVSGFSTAKRRLDAAMRKAAGSVEIPPWRLHDLRRTAVTGMAALGIAPHIADKILNHSGGTIKGVAAVYNKFGYADERRNALAAWARHVESLVAPSPGNVIPLRA